MALAKNDPEAEVMAALARGDRVRALSVLVVSYGEDVRRHCRRMLGDDDLADEVRQQVFVQALRDVDRCTRRSTYRAWLFGIARHRCLDAVKIDGRRRRRFVPAHELPEPPDPRPSPEDALIERVGLERLEAALAALQPRVREAVVGRYVDGRSYVELAAERGERPGTVQARVSRALPVLRAALLGLVLMTVALGVLIGEKQRSEARAHDEARRQATALAGYEREMKALRANQHAQAALLEEYKAAAKQAERVAPPKAQPRRELKVNCDPSDPLCGI